MRTQHRSLNNHLHRFGIIEDREYLCEETTEIVAHYLLQCNDYDKELRKEMGAERICVENLLGYPNLIKHTLIFVEKPKFQLLIPKTMYTGLMKDSPGERGDEEHKAIK